MLPITIIGWLIINSVLAGIAAHHVKEENEVTTFITVLIIGLIFSPVTSGCVVLVIYLYHRVNSIKE
jgi:biotin transporter BioY